MSGVRNSPPNGTNSWEIHLNTIDVAKEAQGVMSPLKFLEDLVILCFEKRRPTQILLLA